MSVSLSLHPHPNPNQKNSHKFRRIDRSPALSVIQSKPVLQFYSQTKFLPLKPSGSRDFFFLPANYFGFLFRRKLGFAANVSNGDGNSEEVVDEAENARGRSTMPDRFRYLTKEAPDRPVRWPWLIALFFLIYTWRTVAWELTNWKKAIVSISRYLFLLISAVIFHFFGDLFTTLIRYTETSVYFVRSIYFSVVAAAPVQELTVIIMLTSAVMAIAEAVVPDSVTNQPDVLTVAGLIGFGVIAGFIPVLLFWFLLLGLFCYSRFAKKRDDVASALPVAAVLAAVGEPWVRGLVMALYLVLAIVQHSRSPEGKSEPQILANGQRRLPVPLFLAALAIGINVSAKWLRYRHLTWMIV